MGRAARAPRRRSRVAALHPLASRSTTPALRAALSAALADADWLVFTSRRGVEAFAELLANPRPARRRLAAAPHAAARVTLPSRAGRASAPRPPTRRARCSAASTSSAPAARPRSPRRSPTTGASRRRACCSRSRNARRRARAQRWARRRALHALRRLPHRARAARRAETRARRRSVPRRRAREPVGRERLRASGGSRRAGRDLYHRAVDDGRGPGAGLDVTAEAREPSLEGILEAMQ